MRIEEISATPEQLKSVKILSFMVEVFSLSHLFKVYVSERGFPKKNMYIVFLNTTLNILDFYLCSIVI